MKMTVDIDCTPEEARRFLGLPDLQPLHDAYLSKMQRMIEEGVGPDAIESMIRSWSPMGEAGLALWRQMFEQIGAPKRS
jgi:hypothetical protein